MSETGKAVNAEGTGSKTPTIGKAMVPSPPITKPPAPPQGGAPPAPKATSADTDKVSAQAKKSTPKRAKGKTPLHNGVDPDTFNHIFLVATTVLDRDRQLVLAKALAGICGGHVSFPEARDTRVRKELFELATDASGKSEKEAKPKSEKKEKKDAKGQKKQAPNKVNEQLRLTDEHKQLVAAQEALRAERTKLALAKGTEDPRLSELVETLEKAKKALFERREAIKSSLVSQ